MANKPKRSFKKRLVRFGSIYLLVVALLALLTAAVCKSSHQIEARATFSNLAVSATLPLNAKRMVGVGSLLDIPVTPPDGIPYSLRLPVDSVSAVGGSLSLVAYADSAEVAGLDIPDSLTVVVNTPSMTIFEYWFGW